MNFEKDKLLFTTKLLFYIINFVQPLQKRKENDRRKSNFSRYK